jgi:hypothetical protein
VATNASPKKKKKKKTPEILAMKNKPFEHGTVIKKDLTVAGDSIFNGFKTMLKYAMQLSSHSNILIQGDSVARGPKLLSIKVMLLR